MRKHDPITVYNVIRTPVGAVMNGASVRSRRMREACVRLVTHRLPRSAPRGFSPARCNAHREPARVRSLVLSDIHEEYELDGKTGKGKGEERKSRARGTLRIA